MAPIAKKNKKQSTNSSSSSNNNDDKTKEEVNVQVFLTGDLARLPTEILIDIIGACLPREAMRFLASCKALTLLARSSETFVFRKLYHDLPPLQVKGSFHHVYSPRRTTAMKEKSQLSTEEPLPADVVLSWKAQYIGACLGNASSLPNITPCCMSCYESNTLFLSEPRWGIRLCQLCFARNLVTKSNLSTYSLTANDVLLAGLKSIEIAISDDAATSKKGLFYSALQLDCLAREKHGEKYSGPRPSISDDEAQQNRSDLVAVAYFLHAGLNTHNDLKDSRPSTIENPVNLKLEFDHYISDKPLKKNSGIKKRPVEDILEDLISIIAYARSKPASESNYPEKKLQKSAHVDQVLPTDSMIAAYRQFSEVTQRNPLPYTSLFYISAEPELLSEGVSLMQNYLIDPTPANLSSYVSLQRSFGITYQHPYLKKAIKTKLNYNDITAPSAMLSVKPPNEGLSITSQNRLKLISQIAMIIGDEFAFMEGGQIKSGEHWGSIYFDRGYRTVELVERVYLVTVIAYRRSLEDYGSRFSLETNIKESYGSQFGPWRLVKFCPLYSRGMYQRVDFKLSDRISVPRKLVENQIEYALKLYRDSIISSSALRATINITDAAECDCDGDENCKSLCWIFVLAPIQDMIEEEEYEMMMEAESEAMMEAEDEAMMECYG